MLRLGVSSLVIASVSAVLTVALIEVKLSVFLSTKVAATDLHRESAISYATFFSIRLAPNDLSIGSTSS